MKIALLTRSLERGGAERQLCLLAAALQQRGHDVVVLTFYPGGALAGDLAAANIRRIVLEKRSRWDLAGFFMMLLRILRQERPAVLYSFMPTANLTAAVAKAALPWLKIVWGIRASPLDLQQYDRTTRWTYRLELLLRNAANAIVANSHAGLRPFLARGYRSQSAFMIPNGVDAARFAPDAEARRRLRQAWHIADDRTLIGIAARIDPMKDHSTFIRAAKLIAAQRPEAHFAVIGTGDEALRRALEELVHELGLAGRFSWIGPHDDMPAVYNALDLLVLSSAFGEGFPNVLAEAQACETACIATDVGECRLVLGDDGVVPPRDPAALAALALRVLDQAAGQPAGRRARMERNFSVAHLAEQTEAVLKIAAGGH